MNNILFVFLGGGAGSVVRCGISVLVKAKFQFIFPIATLTSNILSCIVLGLAVGIFSEKIGENDSLKSLLIIGFCGGFSTFSTFSFETVELIRGGNTIYALANILISVIVCIGIIFFLTKSASV